jgi:hypothetical protein
MLKVRSFTSLLWLLSLITSAQNTPVAKQQASGNVPVIQLENASTKEVPFVTIDALTIPIHCATDGTSFVQLAPIPVNPRQASSGTSDILSVSKNGNQVVQFSLSKVNDINEPQPSNFAVGDSDLYVLVIERIPENKILKFKKPNGEIYEQPAARLVNYIVHFKKDGSYAGAVRLDIPLNPLQIGIFPSGDFLVAGDEERTFEPRIALVKSNGQFQRFVALPGDLHGSDQQEAAGDSPDKKNGDATALPRFGKGINANLWSALRLSMLIPYGRNMLLVRPGHTVPVFSISPGGEVTAIKLEMPTGYALQDLRVGSNSWIGFYTRKREDGNGLEIETAVHDPATGKMIARYAYPHSLGLAVACVSQGQINFLTTQDNGKLILNTFSIPAPAPSKEMPPHDGPH